MLKEIWKVRNGDYLIDYYIYACDHCKKKIEESWPYRKVDENHYCMECSFFIGIITEDTYLRSSGLYGMNNYHAGIHEGKVYSWVGNTAPWEPTLRELRRTKEYRAWRKEVMIRGKGKCNKCKTTESLETHHKNPFAKFPELRFEVTNGVVLCNNCHKLSHKKPIKKKRRKRL